MNHKRYVLNWHARTITVYVNWSPEPERVTSFAEALSYQRNIVAMLLKSLERNRFEMVAPVGNSWCYEGYGS